MTEKIHKGSDDQDRFFLQIQSPEIRAELIKLARRKGIPESDCEDIASEAIEEAIRKQSDYDPGRASVSVWITGIAENVVRNHRRKREAKKRKPDGVVVSLDAPTTDSGDSRCEPRDAVAETNRRSSEEIQHYIDSAKLSEKEDSAVAGHVDKQPSMGGARFSSSTARRAIKKLKQVASDEKFRERPQGPERSECAYGRLPVAEHDAALLYDALRRTRWFVNAINCWRKAPRWKDLQAYLQNQRVLKRFPLAIKPEHWPKQLSRYRDAAHHRDAEPWRRFEWGIEMAVAFPEWPKVSYCQMQPGERRQRLEQFGWSFGPEPFWDIDERTFEFFTNAADEKPPPTTLGTFLKYVNETPDSGSHAYSSTHLVRVDWRYPVKTIVESFKKWAANKQSGIPKEITQSGRSRTTRLVGFACMRLIDDFGLPKDQAMSWLRERFGARVPCTLERLERAVRATRDSLKDFLPSPAEIGV